MLYTSQDLLYIVLAFCILWLTIFFSWVLYYIAMILRDAYRMFGEMKQRLESIDKFISVFTEKLEHTSSYLALLVDGFGKLVTYLQDKKGKKKRED